MLDFGEDDRADQNLAARVVRAPALFFRRLLAGDLLLLESLRLLEPFFQIGDPILDTGHSFTSSKRMAGILGVASENGK